jgi:hypothetical protein
MNIKNLVSIIFDEDDEEEPNYFLSDANLLKIIKHFANGIIIDLCTINGSINHIDLKTVDAKLDNDSIVIIIPDYIKKYINKKISKKEIIVKFKLD